MFRRLFALCILLTLGAGVQGRAVKPLNTDSYRSAYQLSIEIFNGTLKTKSYALVEFYASWCPSCRHFASEYEKIALYFKNISLSTGESVFVARVDCALEAELCNEFGVEMYPSLYFGRGKEFREGSKAVKFYGGKKSTHEVVSWVAKNTGERISYDEKVVASMQELQVMDPEMASATPENKNDWHMDDIEKTTLMLFDTMKESNSSRRQAVYDVLAVFATSHPSMRCRRASELLVEQFEEFWPADAQQAPKAFTDFAICPGADAKALQWRACKGSRPDSRGYTCGLWTLFHGLSVRLPTRPHIGEQFVAMLRAFGENFFRCSTCREHFLAMLRDHTTSKVRPAPASNNPRVKAAAKEQDIDSVHGSQRVPKLPKTRFEAAILLWEMHNAVNARLALEEAEEADENNGVSFSGDSAFPKVQFPSQQRCPRCYKTTIVASSGDNEVDVTYDKWQVFRFLERVYGALNTDTQFDDEKLPEEKSFFHGMGPLALLLILFPIAVVLIILFVGDRQFLRAAFSAAKNLRSGGGGASGHGGRLAKSPEYTK